MTNILADIDFARDSGEFVHTAPLLRYVAGINMDADRKDFIAACVARGYNEATAGVCWAAGRKFMKELENE